jgi:hypothetical protein
MMSVLSAFGLQAMDYSGGGGGGGMVAMLIQLVVMEAVYAIFWWKLFAKAGQPGWASLVPIYNAVVLLKIAGKPIWWLIVLCIPVVGPVLVGMAIAEKFGKSQIFGIVGCGLLGVGYPILGFGSATYQGAGAAPGVAPARA